MTVVAFPLYIEIDSLMSKYNITDDMLDKSLVRKAIVEVRKVHGAFKEHHFCAIIQLLNHDWLPSDIPVLLP